MKMATYTEYASLAEAEAKLEPTDVKNNEYTVTDADGQSLCVTVEAAIRHWLFGLLKVEVEQTKILPR